MVTSTFKPLIFCSLLMLLVSCNYTSPVSKPINKDINRNPPKVLGYLYHQLDSLSHFAAQDHCTDSAKAALVRSKISGIKKCLIEETDLCIIMDRVQNRLAIEKKKLSIFDRAPAIVNDSKMESMRKMEIGKIDSLQQRLQILYKKMAKDEALVETIRKELKNS